MPKKLDRPKESLVEKVQKNIELAFSFQEVDNWKKDSLRFIDYFKGKYHESVSGSARYVVNTVFNLINLIVPNLFFKDPFIRVKPKRKNLIRKTPGGEKLVIPGWRSAA